MSVLVLLVIVPGALVTLVSFHAAMRLGVNTDSFLSVVEKLLRNGNRERAEALTRASEAPVVVVARRALELRLPRFDPEGHAGDYREAPEQSFEERAREALSPTVAEQLSRYRLSLYASVLVLVAVAAAAVLVWREGLDTMPGLGFAALGLGLLSGALNLRRYLRAKSDLRRTIGTLAPFVHRA